MTAAQTGRRRWLLVAVIALGLLVVYSLVWRTVAWHSPHPPIRRPGHPGRRKTPPPQQQQRTSTTRRPLITVESPSSSDPTESSNAMNEDRNNDCTNNKHFSLTPPVMPADFLEFQRKKIRRIEKQWSTWARFDKEDISQCDLHTPECAFFKCLGSEKGYRKCCVEHRLLRDTSYWVVDVLTSNGIRYFLSTGTALGAVRHRGVIIPWDTDVDIAIFPEDAAKVKSIFSTQKEHFFHEDGLGKRMFWIHASADGVPSDGPHVEIFYEADYTKRRDVLLPLEPCPAWYQKKEPVMCPKRDMFDLWFSKGWNHYTGCHYHKDGVSTMYGSKGRTAVRKC